MIFAKVGLRFGGLINGVNEGRTILALKPAEVPGAQKLAPESEVAVSSATAADSLDFLALNENKIFVMLIFRQ